MATPQRSGVLFRGHRIVGLYWGFYAAIQSVFDIHQTGHGNALSESGLPILMLLDDMKADLSKPVSTSNNAKA